MSSLSSNSDQPVHIALRAETAADEPFLFDVYASTRQEELDATGWDAAARRAFLSMQFNAMRKGYHSMFPGAAFSIILVGDQPAGLQVLNRTTDEIRLVDLALLPKFRQRGIGTQLMKVILTEAAQANKPVRLHVYLNSRATAFYERLGFVKIGQPDMYQAMEWKKTR